MHKLSKLDARSVGPQARQVNWRKFCDRDGLFGSESLRGRVYCGETATDTLTRCVAILPQRLVLPRSSLNHLYACSPTKIRGCRGPARGPDIDPWMRWRASPP